MTEMDPYPHLSVFEMVIRRLYPDLNFEASLQIEKDYDEQYFNERKISFFRSSEDFQTLDFKVRRFRNRFFISGTIDKVSSDHIVTRFIIKTALKIGTKRKGTPEVIEKLDELREIVDKISKDIHNINKEIIDLKNFSAQGFGLSTPSHYSAGYTNFNYPITITHQDPQGDYVEMSPRVTN